MSNAVDRRRFLAAATAAGAVTGAAWVAPTVVGSSDAFALTSGSDCPYAGTLHWADASWPSGGTTGTDAWVGGNLTTGGIPVAPDNSANGAMVRFVAKVGGTGNAYVYVLVQITAVGPPLSNTAGSTPRTGGPRPDGYGPDEYSIASKTAASNPSTTSGGYRMQFSFHSDDPITNPSAPTVTVPNITFELRDIDGNPSTYYEHLWITGSATTPVQVGSNPNLEGAGTAASPWRNRTSASDLTPPAGNITVTIPSTSSFTVNDAAKGNGTDKNHGWSIGELTWGCS